jgi:hypothetical protein
MPMLHRGVLVALPECGEHLQALLPAIKAGDMGQGDGPMGLE